jgi:hypothetical protein
MAIARNLVRFKSLFEHPTALVVEGAAFRTGAEMTAALASAGGYKMRVFGDIDQARDWIHSVDASERASL